MKQEIDLNKLRQKSLYVATPAYGGQVTSVYATSMMNLTAVCVKYGIQMQAYFVNNESLIPRARNMCAEKFKQSGFTHLMFIDGDIEFSSDDILMMLDLCNGKDDKGIIAGPYPKKTIAWEKVIAAYDRGYGRENPTDLKHFMADFVVNLVDNNPFNIDEPVKVKETGTGFMMIHKEVLEEWDARYPDQLYRPDHARTEGFDGSKMVMAYFDCVIAPDSKRYLSEDYMFCDWSRKLGIDVWLCPWVHLKHLGSHVFEGSIQALAQIQMPLTIEGKPTESLTDVDVSGKIKKSVKKAWRA